ncbi:hypothetical protein M413DRAFT_447612 [Hebeloma cylindrosporum]|uniref:Transmembrane protein n=1 Tax=Hebeloma cylindrosporum TaxID=76867 RepID=A0A0C3C4X1_HEBCY|nr:hypothetical protein M413DRAFT_447612 [Hebeloma cylindrosporum h7]
MAPRKIAPRRVRLEVIANPFPHLGNGASKNYSRRLPCPPRDTFYMFHVILVRLLLLFLISFSAWATMFELEHSFLSPMFSFSSWTGALSTVNPLNQL